MTTLSRPPATAAAAMVLILALLIGGCAPARTAKKPETERDCIRAGRVWSAKDGMCTNIGPNNREDCLAVGGNWGDGACHVQSLEEENKK